jgi:hypothetical protein
MNNKQKGKLSWKTDLPISTIATSKYMMSELMGAWRWHLYKVSITGWSPYASTQAVLLKNKFSSILTGLVIMYADNRIR